MAAGMPIITTPVYGIAEQVQPSVNALIYQPGDSAALAGHLGTLATDEALRRSMAERSPQVLRSLPNDSHMNELYRRTIVAAAESSPSCPTPRPGTWGEGQLSGRRSWFVDRVRRSRAPFGRHRAGVMP